MRPLPSHRASPFSDGAGLRLEQERDEAIEAHEEMKQARDDVRDEKWDEYLNEK
jgi:hypothetical protein